MKKFIEGLALVIGALVIITLILGLPVMWLWNWIIPELFYLDTITFWQAVGLNLLSSILFKSYNTKK